MTISPGSFRLAIGGALLPFLGHLLPAQRTDLSPECTLPAGDQRIPRVVACINADLDQQLLMDKLAGIANLSASHFARLFRETPGMTAHAHVMRQRIDCANRGMSETSDPITSIALASGFGFSAHFATVLRAHVGVSPSDYRAATS